MSHMTVGQIMWKVLWLLVETCGEWRHHMAVPLPHREMRIPHSSLSSLDYFLSVIQDFFCQFTCQSNTCFGMVMIGRQVQLTMNLVWTICAVSVARNKQCHCVYDSWEASDPCGRILWIGTSEITVFSVCYLTIVVSIF